jgi:hypothetical protein
MNEDKTRVILLGRDPKLLANVTDRVNKTRPAEVQYFTDLKDFLETCMDEQPDLIGVSVSYPHKSISKFPKFFNTALNTPVVIYGENQDLKTRKLLSASQADLKIQGVITAHNLWMKILNLQKIIDEELKKKSSKKNGDNSEGLSDSVFLKDNSSKKVSEQDRKALLSNLFSQLENPDNVSGQTHLNLVSSQSAGESESNDNSRSGSSAASNINHISGSMGDRSKGGSSSELSMASDMNQVSGQSKTSSFMAQGGSEKSSMSHVSSKTGDNVSMVESGEKDSAMMSGTSDSAMKSSGGPSDSDSQQNQQDDSPPKKDSGGEIRKNDANSLETGQEAADMTKDSTQAETDDEENPKDSPFGKIQMADEEEYKKEQEEKKQAKSEQEESKKSNILQKCCKESLQFVFGCKDKEVSSNFNVDEMNVITVDLSGYKGYLVITNSTGQLLLEDEIESFRTQLITSLQENGSGGLISRNYGLNLQVNSYTKAVREFADFTVQLADSSREYTVSFVKREVLTPNLAPE